MGKYSVERAKYYKFQSVKFLMLDILAHLLNIYNTLKCILTIYHEYNLLIQSRESHKKNNKNPAKAETQKLASPALMSSSVKVIFRQGHLLLR